MPDGQTGRRSLAVAVADYLADVKLTHKPRSYTAYNTALVYFMESCHKLNIKDIERRDLLKFSAYLRDEKKQQSVINTGFSVPTAKMVPTC